MYSRRWIPRKTAFVMAPGKSINLIKILRSLRLMCSLYTLTNWYFGCPSANRMQMYLFSKGILRSCSFEYSLWHATLARFPLSAWKCCLPSYPQLRFGLACTAACCSSNQRNRVLSRWSCCLAHWWLWLWMQSHVVVLVGLFIIDYKEPYKGVLIQFFTCHQNKLWSNYIVYILRDYLTEPLQIINNYFI